MTDARWETDDVFRVLGPLEVESDDGPIAIPGERPRALLTALLLQPNAVVSTDRLVDALWGEDRRTRPPTPCSRWWPGCAAAWGRSGPSSCDRARRLHVLAAPDGALDAELFESPGAGARACAQMTRSRCGGRLCSTRRSRCGEARRTASSRTVRRGRPRCGWRSCGLTALEDRAALHLAAGDVRRGRRQPAVTSSPTTPCGNGRSSCSCALCTRRPVAGGARRVPVHRESCWPTSSDSIRRWSAGAGDPHPPRRASPHRRPAARLSAPGDPSCPGGRVSCSAVSVSSSCCATACRPGGSSPWSARAVSARRGWRWRPRTGWRSEGRAALWADRHDGPPRPAGRHAGRGVTAPRSREARIRWVCWSRRCAGRRRCSSSTTPSRCSTELAPVVERLVAAAPGLLVLATSRERLASPREHVHLLAPLPLPSGPDRDNPAIRLFLERAHGLEARHLTERRPRRPSPSSAVGSTGCRSRSSSGRRGRRCSASGSSATQIAAGDRPARRRAAYGGGAASHPARGRRRVVRPARDGRGRLFARLAVFPGPFDLDAGAGRSAPTTGCGRRDRRRRRWPGSSSSRWCRRADGRFRLLETLRTYAAERLADAGPAAACARRTPGTSPTGFARCAGSSAPRDRARGGRARSPDERRPAPGLGARRAPRPRPRRRARRRRSTTSPTRGSGWTCSSGVCVVAGWDIDHPPLSRALATAAAAAWAGGRPRVRRNDSRCAASAAADGDGRPGERPDRWSRPATSRCSPAGMTRPSSGSSGRSGCTPPRASRIQSLMSEICGLPGHDVRRPGARGPNAAGGPARARPRRMGNPSAIVVGVLRDR